MFLTNLLLFGIYLNGEKKMNKRKLILGILLLASLIAASFFMSHLASISAKRSYKALDGVSIVLDAGHGGIDDGARCNEAKEQEINLRITKKLANLLEKNGAKVTLTRNGKYDLASESAKNRKKEDMKKRVEIINREETDLFLSIHLNAYPNTSVKGAVTFYKKDNAVSKVFADKIQKKLKELTNTKMTAKAGDYYILNNSHKIGALVECGFLSNVEDRSLLVTDAYQQKIADVLYASISEYFEIIG